jgi:multidrug efflux pump
LASMILKDPAVQNLSSFIGVDGTNTTLNSGRILITLKPLGDRKLSASDVIQRMQPNLEKVEGITLYMQPVQDLTVEDRVSRTEYQYSLEDPDQNELNTWTAKFVQKLQGLPQLRDVATDQQTSGLAASLVIDRVTASRMGITPQMIDQTLYDAFGQREISTLYTQLNQYHVILETLPEFQHNPAKLQDIYVRSATAATGSSSSGGSSISGSSSGATAGTTGPSANSTSASSTVPAVSGANGAAVPLSAFTHLTTITAPLAINHTSRPTLRWARPLRRLIRPKVTWECR